MPEPFVLDFSDEDLNAALRLPDEAEGLDEDESETPAFSEELGHLTRRLVGQHIDLIIDFTQSAFSSVQAPTGPVDGALSALMRLTEATHERELYETLRELRGALPGEALPIGTQARSRFLQAWRRQLLRLSHDLNTEDGARLRRLLDHRGRRLPLLAQLSTVRGVGPRRLSRLYCAGLYTINAIESADPEDVAAVTGLPRPLARRVVTIARRFAEQEREQAHHNLDQQADRFLDVLEGLTAEQLSAAQQTLQRLQTAIAQRQAHLNELD